MKTIILDTNFIAYCVKYKIDFKTELKEILNFNFQLKIIDKTIQELSKLKQGKLAIQIIKDIKQIKSTKDVDSTILEQKDVIVATLDKELKRKLKKKNIPLITLRNKKYITTESFIK